jgi:DNA-binding PadR family transcriptional regulator
MKEVESHTEGRVKMGPGTLYGSIKRMLSAGLIQETDDRPDPELDNERRRYYRLTGVGEKALRTECTRMEQAVTAAKLKKVLPSISNAEVGG